MKECDKGCVNILCICNIRTFIYLQIVNIVTLYKTDFTTFYVFLTVHPVTTLGK
jgi:hypothetical protein